jgi:hypothetical protein
MAETQLATRQVPPKVSSLTGTTDQVIVSASTGDVTLSLPQDIATASEPTFGAIKLLDTDDSHALTIVPGSNLSAARVLTITTGDSDRTLTLSANATIGGTSSGTNTGDQTSVTGNAGTATALQTARAINGVNFDGTAAITVTAAAGTLTGTTLNATVVTSSLTTIGTIGTGVWQGTVVGSTYGGTGVNNAGRTLTISTSSGTISFTTAVTLTVAATASVSGTNTGDQTSVTGNAGTATALQTARAINGVNFDGTAAITVTAAAGTLTGTTLNATVVTSSLTAVGTIGTGVWQGSVIDSTYGGTGVNNAGRTLTISTSSGTISFTSAVTLTVAAAASVSGTNTGDQTSVTGNAGTATALQTARAINGTNFDGTAAITVTAAAGTLTGTTLNATVVTSSLTTVGTIGTGAWQGTVVGSTYGGTGVNNSGRTLTISTSSGTISFTTAVTLTVAATASVSGTNTGDQTTVTGNAGTATALQTARTIGGVSFDGTANIVPQTIEAANEAADTTCFPLFITASGTQSLQPKNNVNLTYNSATGAFGSTSFVGALTGNASTATALATARAINGTNFDGTAAITVTAAAGTLTGTTLNATVVTSSLTAVGTIGTGVWQGTVIDPQYGGTGVNNGGRQLTVATTSGTISFTSNVTLTVAATASISGTHSGTSSGTNTGDQTTVTGNAGTATALQTSRTLWGQSFDGTGNVTGSLASVTDITGGASSMIVTAGTGVSRTLTFRTTTAGSVATTALTLAADQSATFANTVNATTFVGALTGNATTATALATTRAIYGNNFDGTAALTQIIGSAFGGTANGFTKFSGPATTEKTFTLPNASATILTDNAVVTSAQGGTGVNNGGRTLTINTNNGTISFTSAVTLTVANTASVSGTNTGDQTTITGNAGTATALATARAIYGNNFDGTAALAQVIASTYGGTGNGFAKLSGPATTEKTFTLPNASATILTDNAVVTAAQGGTGVNNSTRTLTINTNSGTISFTSAVTLTVANTASVSGTNTGDQTTVTGNAGTATALQNSRTLWGQSFDGTGNVTGSLTSVADITGGASSMTVTAGTGASRTMVFKTTTAGSVATTALTLAADQSATFANTVNATTFVGALSGNASTSTTAVALVVPRLIGNVSFDGGANIVPQTIESANEATDTTCFVLFVTASGTVQLQPKNNVNLTFNSNTGAFGASSLTGLLNTASQTNITGLGTITTGTWSATTIGLSKGGSGADLSATGPGVLRQASAAATVTVGQALDYIVLKDLKPSGTQGGTATAGSWETRTLNTEEADTGNHCTLASNQFTLLAGTYRIRAIAQAGQNNGHQAKLRNVTDGTDTIFGTSMYCSTTANYPTHSEIVGRFTIAGTKTFEIQHKVAVTLSGYGYGIALSFGTEVYTIVELWREIG